MIRTLDRAIAELVGPIPTLRAAVLSVAPDGLIAWSWSREPEQGSALNFGRLDRAATICLEALGAAREGRSLMLCARDTWVVSWPLYDAVGDAGDGADASSRMVLTVVFSGELQNGMVLLHGRRVLGHVRAALDEARGRSEPLRGQLVELLVRADDPGALIERLAEGAAIDLRRFERLEGLTDEERGRLALAVADA